MCCGKLTSDEISNKFLGKLLSIEKNYGNQLEEKEKEIEECTDIEDAHNTQYKKLGGKS